MCARRESRVFPVLTVSEHASAVIRLRLHVLSLQRDRLDLRVRVLVIEVVTRMLGLHASHGRAAGHNEAQTNSTSVRLCGALVGDKAVLCYAVRCVCVDC